MCYDGGYGYTIRPIPGRRLSLCPNTRLIVCTKRYESVQVQPASSNPFYANRTSLADFIRQDLVNQEETMIAAEKLLRISLFSDELPMSMGANLADRRKKLAGTIRAFRKKGVIPVFVSTLWFLLAMAISIQSAFEKRGTNEAAHDLALGLLLAFLPIFILSCIVDRNTVAAGRISVKLNHLLACVRNALLDDELRLLYSERIHASPEFFNWIRVLDDDKFDEFFTGFAGQARIRWHYGVAHPLLCSFEDSFIAEHGRGWLPEDNANRAKTLVRIRLKYITLFDDVNESYDMF